jgi:uridylate kinase
MKAHIAKLNELTESEVTELTSSKVDETAFAIVKRQKMSKNPESKFAEENQIGHPV